MAKKQNVAKKVVEVVKPVVEPQPPAKRSESEPPARTELVLTDPTKTKGSVRYRIPGVVGSLRVARGLFAGAPPARLVVLGPLAQPDPEKEAKARQTAEQRAAKLEARIARAQATAARSAARLEKLRAKLEVK